VDLEEVYIIGAQWLLLMQYLCITNLLHTFFAAYPEVLVKECQLMV